MSNIVAALDNGGQSASLSISSSINQIIIDDPQPVALDVVVLGGGVISQSQELSIALNYNGEVVQGGAIAAENWFGDMALQLYNWRSLFYLDWWGS